MGNFVAFAAQVLSCSVEGSDGLFLIDRRTPEDRRKAEKHIEEETRELEKLRIQNEKLRVENEILRARLHREENQQGYRYLPDPPSIEHEPEARTIGGTAPDSGDSYNWSVTYTTGSAVDELPSEATLQEVYDAVMHEDDTT